MHPNRRQAQFLEEMQRRIDRYQPILEAEFGVTLGTVEARPLVVRELVNYAFAKAIALRSRECERDHRWSPSPRLLAAERTLLWIPSWVFCYIRFWYPSLIMKWQPPAILVSFLGWTPADFETNSRRVDQFAVHELAHGIWSQISSDDDQSHTSRRRLWNEGFAHYVADIAMRDHYPPGTHVKQSWPAFRQHARLVVSDAVHHHGPEILRQIPVIWPELDARLPTPK